MVIIMLNIIKKFLLLILLMGLLVIPSSACEKKHAKTEISTTTAEDSIKEYFQTEKGFIISDEQLKNTILIDFTSNSNHYYVMKDIQEIETKRIPVIYVLEVTTYHKKYSCTKITADFSLASNESIEDKDYTPYLECIIPLNDLYIHAGILFDTKYTPYFQGAPLAVDSDNIFICISQSEEESISFISE